MNITVVSHDSFWPLRGGGGLRVYWIVKKLLEKKHNVTVIAPFVSMQGVKEEFPNAKLINLGNITRFSKNKELNYLKMGWKITKNLFKNPKPDVIYAHNVVSAFPALVYSKIKGIPLIYDIDDFTMGLSKFKLIEKYGPLIECYTAKHSDKVIAAYEELKIQLEKHNVKGITVVRHGVDLDIFKPNGKSKNQIVYMGGIEKHDGTLLIPEAAEIILKKYPKIEFLIIGDGSDFQNLKNLTKEKNIEKSFIFKGWTEHNKIPNLIAGAKVGLVTHLKSFATDMGLPLKGYEYMAMEIPFVAPNLEGIKKEVGNKKLALLFKFEDSKDLAEKVINLLDNKEISKEMSIKGRKFVLEYCNWPKNAKNICEICEKTSFIKLSFP